MNANNHIDHNIDRALAGLRDAQPRSGLNGRVLASLEHRATNPGGLPFHKPGSPASVLRSLGWMVKGWGIARGSARGNTGGSTHFALWCATSAAILAIASLAILHRSAPNKNAVILSEASHSDAQSKNPATARVRTNAEPFSTTKHTSVEPIHRMAHLANATMPVACAHSECPTHDDSAVVMSGTTQDLDAQAVADWHAPSHPAPPLPLTPEEKLFRRMLQYRNATQLAELDPVVRAKENADETTAFKAFFPDPPPLKQPLGDTE